MTETTLLKAAFFLSLGLAATAPTLAQTAQPGDLTGNRPSRRATTSPAAAASPRAPRPASDSLQQHLLNEDINLNRARASELPDLYEHLMEATRAERRQWSEADWNAAADVLARLNGRYQDVRSELSMQERLRIRTLQGEFYSLKGARTVSNKLND